MTAVKPSPPVGVASVCTGGSRKCVRLVPPGRALGLVARTATTLADGGSLPTNVLPSVDRCGVQPGGTFSDPGTYSWLAGAPWIRSVIVAAPGVASLA